MTGKNNPFKNLTIVVCDPDQSIRQAARSYLKQEGVRDIVDIKSFSKAWEYFLSNNPCDAIFISADMEHGATFGLVKAIREEDVFNNPFLPIIYLTSNNDQAWMKRLGNTGPTDLMLKPISPSAIKDRLMKIARQQQYFFVTSSYIGPDRRRRITMDGEILEDRREISEKKESVLTMNIPNCLQARMTGASDGEIARIIQAGKIKAERHRRIATAFDVSVSVDLTINAWNESNMKEYEKRLGDVCDAAQSCIECLSHEHGAAAALVVQILYLSQTLRDNPEADNTELRLLKPISLAVCMAVYPDFSEKVILSEITRLVDSFNKSNPRSRRREDKQNKPVRMRRAA